MKNNSAKPYLIFFLKFCFYLIIFLLIMYPAYDSFGIISNGVTLEELIYALINVSILIGYLIVIKCLLGLVSSLEKSPFTHKNVNRLNIISRVFLVATICDAVFESLFVTGGICQILGLNITVTLITLSILTLTFMVLAEVFEKAVKIKEDNDLTI